MRKVRTLRSINRVRTQISGEELPWQTRWQLVRRRAVFGRLPPYGYRVKTCLSNPAWLATRSGGFHFEFDEAEADWRCTRSGALFKPFVVEQMRLDGNVILELE